MENKIYYYETLDSTNTRICQMAMQGAEQGTVVVANQQTAGKGRRGREWESPAGENIYMSILLRPEIEANQASMLTLVMAYSVAKVLRKAGFLDAKIKWPNDIVLSGKKVCGILTEMFTKDTDIDYVVIGVGVNVNTKGFPEEIKDTATSLYLRSGVFVDKDTLLEDILECFWNEYDRFLTTGHLSYMRDEYNYMLVNCNQEVRVLEPGKEYQARAIGINDAGELMVQTPEGDVRNVFAGEVSVRGVYGYV